MAFDIEGAKKAGASDEQIAEFLANKYGFNLEGAKKAGAKSSDVVKHLMGKEGGAPKNQSDAETQRLINTEAPQQASEQPSIVERIMGFGSPTARLIKGAVVDPLLGLNQMVANTGLFGETVKQGATQVVRDYEGATQEGRARVGSEGFDPIQFLGAVVSPVNKIGIAGQGANLATRSAMGAGGGAVQGLLATSQAAPEDQASERLVNGAIGAALGGAIPAGIEGAKAVLGIIRRLPITAAAKARAIQRHIGDQIPEEIRGEVAATLREATPATEGRKLSAAEALADNPNAIPLMKEQERVLAAQPEMARTRDLENQQATQQALEGAFGRPSDIPVAKNVRDVVAGDIREQALRQADVYGKEVVPLEKAAARAEQQAQLNAGRQAEATQAAAQKTAEFQAGKPGWLTAGTKAQENLKVANESGNKAATFKAQAEVKQNQAQTLKDEGFYPLETKGIISSIDKELADPLAKVDNTLTYALNSTKQKLMDAVDPETGIIRSDVLYKVRKLINQDISDYLRGQNVTDAPAVEKKIRGILDTAIEKASGSDTWQKYIKEYSSRSQQINQMELGRELLGKLGVDSASGAQKAGVFVEAVNNVTDLLQKITKRSYNSLEEFATPKQVNTLKSVVTDLKRAERAKTSAKYGKQGEGVENPVQNVPTFLDRSLVLTRVVLNVLQNGSAREFDTKIAELMLDPKRLADFIDALPKDRIAPIVQMMTQRMSPTLRESFVNTVGGVAKETATAPITGASVMQGAVRDVQQQGNTPYTVDLEVSRKQLEDNFRRLNAQ